MGALLLVSCSKTEPAKTQIPHTLIKIEEPKSNFGTFINVHIKVPTATTVSDLESLLNKLLIEYQTKAGPPIKENVIRIMAYESDSTQNEVGSISQSFGGRIGFTCNGKTTFDREIEKPTLSREERERQQEVGKFAGELIDAGKKIQTR
jgi:hypothetical protein